jgi:polyhydroxybutyrate depolymerase
MTILGTADEASNYNGVFFGGEQYYVSAAEMHSFWASQNNCNANAVTTLVPDINATDGSTVERNTWSTAEGCAYVEELKVIGGGHDWPGSFGNADINATAELWQFLSRYNLNGLIDCTTTSLDQLNGTNLLYKAYPNPVNALLEIELSEIANAEFKIFNVFGNLVLRGELKSQKNSVDLSFLPTNVYFLKINNQMTKILKIE